MSICRARLHDSSNALWFWMSGRQIRLIFLPKLFGVNSWIAQVIRQRIPDCCSGERKCTGAAANSRNWQLMTSGRSQMLATRNFRDWHTVVGEVRLSSVAKTTMNCHSNLVLHSLRNNQPVQIVMHQPRQPRSYFPDPMCCSILNNEHAATCHWPSSARKTNRVTIVDAWCDKGVDQCMFCCKSVVDHWTCWQKLMQNRCRCRNEENRCTEAGDTAAEHGQHSQCLHSCSCWPWWASYLLLCFLCIRMLEVL